MPALRHWNFPQNSVRSIRPDSILNPVFEPGGHDLLRVSDTEKSLSNHENSVHCMAKKWKWKQAGQTVNLLISTWAPLRPVRKLWRHLNLKGIRLPFRDNRTPHLSTLGQSGLVFCKDSCGDWSGIIGWLLRLGDSLKDAQKIPWDVI